MYFYEPKSRVFRLGGKGKGMGGKNGKIGGLYWKNVGNQAGFLHNPAAISH
jgi:hypothetical protein